MTDGAVSTRCLLPHDLNPHGARAGAGAIEVGKVDMAMLTQQKLTAHDGNRLGSSQQDRLTLYKHESLSSAARWGVQIIPID